MNNAFRSPSAWAFFAFLVFAGCATPQYAVPVSASPPLAEEVRSLGDGIRFLNTAPPKEARAPSDGAEFVYARSFSANSRMSPVGIEIWIFDQAGKPLHQSNRTYVQAVYQRIYGWNPVEWKQQLAGTDNASNILREKSDLFWESLAQQFAERVFGDELTPAIYRFGPLCRRKEAEGCQDPGLKQAHRVVVRTYLDARRDPMNPVSRSIVYSVERGQLENPELIFELQVPNGIAIVSSYQEVLDFRPKIGGRQDAVDDIRLWAHLPSGRRTRKQSLDYPDYNLLFVPLRHLVLQGEVANPKKPGSTVHYPDRKALIEKLGALIAQIRTPENARKITAKLNPFLSPKYYYMFEAGGQGVESYRNYILGTEAGIGRGLDPDFGRIELMIDGVRVAVFKEGQ